MASEPPQEVIGEFTPEEDAERLQGGGLQGAGHSAGFDMALGRALAQLSGQWGTGQFKNVKVTFAANISVTNPGTIDTYIVNLSQ
jgi:hypothetical protein